MTIPNHVVEEYRRLDRVASETQEAQAALVWHWTLDEENPERESLRKCAARVGAGFQTIRALANGYAAWAEGEPGTRLTLAAHIELARMGGERQAAAEALAEAMGANVESVARNHRNAINAVLNDARDAAERLGTTVEEEVHRVAERHERHRQADRAETKERKQAHTLRYVQVDGHLGAARDRLKAALDVAHDVDFDEEEADLIVDRLRQIDDGLRLLNVRFTGDSGTDWDAEKNRLLAGGDR